MHNPFGINRAEMDFHREGGLSLMGTPNLIPGDRSCMLYRDTACSFCQYLVQGFKDGRA